MSDDTGQACELDTVNDTVGALCCLGGALSAGVSSGGVWLKSCGRVGEAAVFGAGCWAQDGGARRALTLAPTLALALTLTPPLTLALTQP